jgi:uncharacterized protein YecT (DUF1311 family)
MKGIRFIFTRALFSLPLMCGAANTAASTQGVGDDIGLRSSYDRCLDAPGGDVPGWVECTAAEFKYQDARLNKVYKLLAEKLNESEKNTLRDSERAWVSDRDALCALSKDSSNGRSINSNDCAAELTAKRAAALEIAMPRGDMASLAPPLRHQPNWKDALQVFATDGNQVLAYQIGFLNDDVLPDVLLVLDPPRGGNETANEGPSRIVTLLTRNAQGQLEKAAQNDKIVPCAKCGGVHTDDPFSFMRIAKSRFFIITEGGSRERWSNVYTFKYSTTQKNWLLSDVKRSVSDTLSDRYRQVELKPKDFGIVKFEDFDPATLPNVDLPSASSATSAGPEGQRAIPQASRRGLTSMPLAKASASVSLGETPLLKGTMCAVADKVIFSCPLGNEKKSFPFAQRVT